MQKLSSLIGLTLEKQKARIGISFCKETGEVFPHTLVYGVGGTGKTSLVRSIAYELNYHYSEYEGATFKNRSDIFHALRSSLKVALNSNKHLLFFVDEVHRLNHTMQEAFYIPMKEWRIEDTPIAHFSLFAATTRFDLLDAGSFITRFQNLWEIKRYGTNCIEQILAEFFRSKNLKFSYAIISSISNRCLGIPRTAINLANKIRSFVVAHKRDEILYDDVLTIFHLEGIDEIGLFDMHREYLRTLVNINHAVGIGTIAAKLRQPQEMIRSSVEPILIEMGFITPTSRGRVITEKGITHISHSS